MRRRAARAVRRRVPSEHSHAGICRTLTGAVLVIFVVVATVIVTGAGGPGTVVVVDDLGQCVIAAIAGGSALWAARRSSGRPRVAWWAIALGLLGWSAGQLVWCVNELLLHRPHPCSPPGPTSGS